MRAAVFTCLPPEQFTSTVTPPDGGSVPQLREAGGAIRLAAADGHVRIGAGVDLLAHGGGVLVTERRAGAPVPSSAGECRRR